MFHLRQQQLIELIRNNKIDDAITFAQNQILPDIHHSVCISISDLSDLSLFLPAPVSLILHLVSKKP